MKTQRPKKETPPWYNWKKEKTASNRFSDMPGKTGFKVYWWKVAVKYYSHSSMPDYGMRSGVSRIGT